MPEPFTPPSITVGVDGSRGAVRAALLAIDEAVSRDIPLRLVYAIEPQDEAHRLAGAELAVRYAANAVEATERRVKVEVEHGSERAAGPGLGWVIVELDESPDTAAVLQFGVAEARLRQAPLRVLGSGAC